MKKIVFFIPFYGYPVPSVMGGGIEELMTLLLNENEKDQNSKYKFYFIHKALYGKTKKQFDQDFKFKNSEIIKIKYNRFFNTMTRIFNRVLKLFKINKRFSNNYCEKSYKAIKKINPDLVVFEGGYDVIAGKLAKDYGKEKVWLHAHMQEPNKELNLTEYFGTILSVSNFISNDYKKFLEDKTQMNYAVLPNCVDEDRFNKQISAKERKEIRTNFGYDDNDFVSVFCGRICEQKGVKQLIQAILSLDEKFKVLIVGGLQSAKTETSPYLQEVSNLAETNPSKVKFTGYIKNSEMYKIYQSADIQVIPSIWAEAAGLIVLEGQHSGLPQIATKSGGMPEFLNPEGSIIIEPDENIVENIAKNIKKLQKNKELCEKLSKSNKVFVKKFSKNCYYDNFIKIIKDV